MGAPVKAPLMQVPLAAAQGFVALQGILALRLQNWATSFVLSIQKGVLLSGAFGIPPPLTAAGGTGGLLCWPLVMPGPCAP